jgi:hypothetical protein
MKIRAFWDVALCSLTEVHQRFRGAYGLHHGPDDGGSAHLWNIVLEYRLLLYNLVIMVALVSMVHKQSKPTAE